MSKFYLTGGGRLASFFSPAMIGFDVQIIHNASKVRPNEDVCQNNLNADMDAFNLAHEMGIHIIRIGSCIDYRTETAYQNYALSKHIGDLLVNYYRERGVRCWNIKPSSLYSYTQGYGFPAEIARKVNNAIMSGEPLDMSMCNPHTVRYPLTYERLRDYIETYASKQLDVDHSVGGPAITLAQLVEDLCYGEQINVKWGKEPPQVRCKPDIILK